MGGGTAELGQPAGGLPRGGAGGERAKGGEVDLRRQGGGVRLFSRRQSGPVPAFFSSGVPERSPGGRDGLGSPDG
jgi:hypothetical protein